MKKPDSHHKDCLAIFQRLSDYLDGELADRDCREIRKHLRGCPDCRTCLESLRRTIALCKSLKTSRIPPSLKRKLEKLFSTEKAAVSKG